MNENEKLFKSSFFRNVTGFLGSCSGEEGKESVSGQGSIMVDLSTNLSYSRAVDESAYRNVNNYKVSLYKGEEPVYTDQLYGDLDVEQKVDFGVSYTLTAYYGEDVAAGYDKLYVKGSQTFTVSQGDKKLFLFFVNLPMPELLWFIKEMMITMHSKITSRIVPLL